MALRARLSGISCHFEPDEIECLVRTAAEALHGQLDDLSERQREVAARAYEHLQDEMRMHDPDVAEAARQAVIDAATGSFTTTEDLRASMADGYSAGDVERILGPIGRQARLHLICIWQYYFDASDCFGGDSNFYIEADGQFYGLSGGLWGWLNLAAGDPDAPATPGEPASWVGSLCTEVTMNDIEFIDADEYNYAIYVM
ncbi:hypothetical protein [Nocardia asiatica]|uniref:hypothetical protein n=1 Tax=Nocardia asiatica TaxID=209252 RepID=UPI00030DE72D|nr:hypothetical protein [Nocardia asiatica]